MVENRSTRKNKHRNSIKKTKGGIDSPKLHLDCIRFLHSTDNVFWKNIYDINSLMKHKQLILSLVNNKNTCSIVKQFVPAYSISLDDKPEYGILSESEKQRSESMLCLSFLILGLLSNKLFSTCTILFKGGKAIQLVLSEIHPVTPYSSNDSDVLIISKTGQYTSEFIAKQIREFIVWITTPIEPGSQSPILPLPPTNINQTEDLVKIAIGINRKPYVISDISYKPLTPELEFIYEYKRSFDPRKNTLRYNIQLINDEQFTFTYPSIISLIDERIYFLHEINKEIRELTNQLKTANDKREISNKLRQNVFNKQRFYKSLYPLLIGYETITKQNEMNPVKTQKELVIERVKHLNENVISYPNTASKYVDELFQEIDDNLKIPMGTVVYSKKKVPAPPAPPALPDALLEPPAQPALPDALPDALLEPPAPPALPDALLEPPALPDALPEPPAQSIDKELLKRQRKERREQKKSVAKEARLEQAVTVTKSKKPESINKSKTIKKSKSKKPQSINKSKKSKSPLRDDSPDGYMTARESPVKRGDDDEYQYYTPTGKSPSI